MEPTLSVTVGPGVVRPRTTVPLVLNVWPRDPAMLPLPPLIWTNPVLGTSVPEASNPAVWMKLPVERLSDPPLMAWTVPWLVKLPKRYIVPPATSSEIVPWLIHPPLVALG